MKPILTSTPVLRPSQAVATHAEQPRTTPTVAQTRDSAAPSVLDPALIREINDKIRQVRQKLDSNKTCITKFEKLNDLRDDFDKVLDLHKSHREALDAVKEDIDKVDLEVIETFYLIEYIKARRSCDIRKKSIDPVTLKKVGNIKLKLRNIEERLDELNNHVDVAWEDFVRRKSNKERRISSLDIIYKTLATNQKIINALKRKVEIEPDRSVSAAASMGLPNVKPREEDHGKFEEFLASRSVVPVRKPIH